MSGLALIEKNLNIKKFIITIILGIYCSSLSPKELSLIALYYHAQNGKKTASGKIIDNKKILSKEYRWVAVSRDLIRNKSLSLGDTIEVISLECPSLNGIWIVHDTMGGRHKNKIDFLLHKKEPEKMNFLNPHKVVVKKRDH